MIDQILTHLQNLTLLDFFLLIAVPAFLAMNTRSFLTYRKLKKEHTERYKELEENKCDGPHTWISMSILGKESHVCKDCCFCPDKEAFVKKEFVNAEVQRSKFDKELALFKEKRIKEIGKEVGLDEDKAKSIYMKFVSIQKDFTLDYIEEMMKMDEEKSEEV